MACFVDNFTTFVNSNQIIMSKGLEFEIPSWMNKEFFENILADNATTPFAEIRFETASQAGDGFASTIFRVICISDKEYRFVVKMAPTQEGFKKQLLMQEEAFATEIQLYKEVLPKMEQVLSDVLKRDIQIGPKLVYGILKPTPTMVLEDMIASGCEPSKTTFGLEDSLVVIKRLAQFHASSVFINQVSFLNNLSSKIFINFENL